jgi:hypothetical protein
VEQQLRDIQHEIERTRERMGGTIDALRYKTDVPLRFQEFVDGIVQRARDAVRRSNAEVDG